LLDCVDAVARRSRVDEESGGASGSGGRVLRDPDLSSDDRALDQEDDRVGGALRLGEARLADEPEHEVTEPGLVLLDDGPRRVLLLTELERRVDQGAAAEVVAREPGAEHVEHRDQA
jgi:hypothetical protein